MSPRDPVIVTVALSDEEAWQVAQFLKRLRFAQARENATSDEEAYRMIYGLGKFQLALKEAGYEPR